MKQIENHTGFFESNSTLVNRLLEEWTPRYRSFQPDECERVAANLYTLGQ